MLLVLIVVSPFLVAAILAALWPRPQVLFPLGLVLALLFVVFVYLSSPTGSAGSDCSDCGEYLGRWWEPWLAAMFALMGLAAWIVGLFAGRGLRRLVGAGAASHQASR